VRACLACAAPVLHMLCACFARARTRQAKLEEMRALKGSEAERTWTAPASSAKRAAAAGRPPRRQTEEEREERRANQEAKARLRAARAAARAAAGRAHSAQRREMELRIAECERLAEDRHRAEKARADEWRRRRVAGQLWRSWCAGPDRTERCAHECRCCRHAAMLLLHGLLLPCCGCAVLIRASGTPPMAPRRNSRNNHAELPLMPPPFLARPASSHATWRGGESHALLPRVTSPAPQQDDRRALHLL
jgi:hypothetical protein